MARLTQYTGGAAQEGGVTLQQLVVSQSEYDDILAASTGDNPDMTDPNYDANFQYTLYYIKEE